MVHRKFEMYHFGKQISWEGYVIRVNLNEDEYTSEPNPDSPWGEGGDKPANQSQIDNQNKTK